jgi:hypothetical protein
LVHQPNYKRRRGSGGNGNGGGNGASANKGPDDSASSSHGALASSLGALNAAHASTTALDSAAPNSRVGRIATYGKVVDAENTLADPNATKRRRRQRKPSSTAWDCPT